jgi:2-polyprenyl-6-methoxyphenol hydroxylase-like FAD-dependent oxidoreductase
MKAIIIGGGIGGLCASLALQQLGHEIAIFEQAVEIRPVGAGLSIWKNGLISLPARLQLNQLLRLLAFEPER